MYVKRDFNFLNLTPIQGSAPNLSENNLNCSISFFDKYFLVSFVTFDSITIFLIAFEAIISQEGYLELDQFP